MPGQLDQTAESIMSQWAAFTRSEQGMELPLRGWLRKQGLRTAQQLTINQRAPPGGLLEKRSSYTQPASACRINAVIKHTPIDMHVHECAHTHTHAPVHMA